MKKRVTGILCWKTLPLLLAAVAPLEAATNVFTVVNSGTSAYVINGASNPNLALVRGFTYLFQINATGHPFWIKTIQGNGTGNGYTNGVAGNATQVGTLIFAVPTNAPSLLFYDCQIHAAMTGQLNIEDPPVVRISSLVVQTNVVLMSTGTAALNVQVAGRSNLITGTWLPVAILTNSYSSGTNTTAINLPTESAMFFQVDQTLP